MSSFQNQMNTNSIRYWSLTGKNRPVKVLSAAGEVAALERRTLSGYITLEKFLYGKTARQIETLLGLRPFELRGKCFVYALGRLPLPHEVDYKFSAAFPHGNLWEDDAGRNHQNMLAAREDFAAGRNLYDRSGSPVAQYYPPGSSMVQQWRLKVPMPIGPLVATVLDTVPFPRESGSVQEYSPHNRGAIR